MKPNRRELITAAAATLAAVVLPALPYQNASLHSDPPLDPMPDCDCICWWDCAERGF